MATFRVGVGSFNIQDGAVGFGTDTDGLGNLKVKGVTKTTDIKVSGASTLTRYSGFAADNINQLENITLTSEVGTIGDIVVGVGTSVIISSASTVTVGTVESVSIGTHFSPPKGGIEERGQDFVEGMMRFNTDLNTMEFYNGNEWRQFTYISDIKNSPSSRGRAALMGGGLTGESSPVTSAITAFNIVVGGRETVFGDLTGTQNASTGLGNRTRGICVRGQGSTPGAIEYVTMASLGDSITFGDLNTVAYRTGGGSSSSTRGLTFGGRGAPGSAHNSIQYIQIQTLGDALDFGDTIVTQRGQGCNIGSPIRGFCIANSTYLAGIEFVTIASKGNSTDFGDNIYGGAYQAGCSNSVRGVIAGGYQFPATFLADQKSYITLASEGNAIDFGDLTEGGNDGLGYAYAAATAVRGVVLGGMDSSPSPSPSRTTVDAFNFDSKGEITVIGDLSQRKRDGACHSDSHGGLGGY